MSHQRQNTPTSTAAVREKTLASTAAKVRIQLYISRAADRAVELAAVQRDVSKSQFVEDAILAYVPKEK